MMTVIMPTLWKGRQYKEMIPLLNQHHLVDDILIIDNDPKNTDTSLFELEKVAFIATTKNLYVNGSWNCAVAKSYYDRLCFYSDDVFFNPAVIDAVYSSITPDAGMLGFSPDVIFDLLPDESKLMYYDSEIEIHPCNEISHGFASTFFMHKSSYYKIPSEFRIFFGDTFLFYMNKQFAKQNYMIANFEARTNMGTTSRKFKKITDNEWQIAEEIFKKYGISKEEWLTNPE